MLSLSFVCSIWYSGDIPTFERFIKWKCARNSKSIRWTQILLLIFWIITTLWQLYLAKDSQHDQHFTKICCVNFFGWLKNTWKFFKKLFKMLNFTKLLYFLNTFRPNRPTFLNLRFFGAHQKTRNFQNTPTCDFFLVAKIKHKVHTYKLIT